MGVDPITIAMVGGSLLSAGSSIVGGMNESAKMRSQAASAEYEAKIADLRGKQISGQRRDELNTALSAIDTLRGSRGLNLDSATGRAIREDRRERSRDAENTEVLGERLKGMSLRNRATGLRSASKWAKIQGFAQAIPDLISAAGGVGGMGGGGSVGGGGGGGGAKPIPKGK